MKKQFDLEYYLSHPEVKVVTRDGIDVTILDTEYQLEDKTCILAKVKADDMQPYSDIIAVMGGHVDKLIYYYTDGTFLQEGLGDSFSHYDLFFDLPDPEKKKVPLTYEDLKERVQAGKTMWFFRDRDTVCNIVDFDDEAAYYVYGGVKKIFPALYEWMFDGGMTFADGDQCWKEVDSCDTCTNDKGCVTCNDGDQWEGGEK